MGIQLLMLMINSEYIAKVANGKVMTYGIDNKADVMAKDIVVTLIG